MYHHPITLSIWISFWYIKIKLWQFEFKTTKILIPIFLQSYHIINCYPFEFWNVHIKSWWTPPRIWYFYWRVVCIFYPSNTQILWWFGVWTIVMGQILLVMENVLPFMKKKRTNTFWKIKRTWATSINIAMWDCGQLSILTYSAFIRRKACSFFIYHVSRKMKKDR